MKTFSKLIKESSGNGGLPTFSRYVSLGDFQTYFEKVINKLTREGRLIIAWMIENSILDGEAFKDALMSSDPGLNNPEVKKALKKLLSIKRIKELPIYMTEVEFNSVVNDLQPLDCVIYDFRTPQGRNEIAKQFDMLVRKTAYSYVNASTLSNEELYSAGLLGLTHAMNKYASMKQDDENKWAPFMQFAAQQIRYYILEEIKKASHIVHIPTSEQDRERKDKGSNTRSFTVSGDAKNGDDKNAKTYFDTREDETVNTLDCFKSASQVCRELIESLYTKLPNRSRDIRIFIDYYGLDGKDAIKGEELTKKYGINAANITRIKKDILAFIKRDSYCMELMSELLELNNSDRA